MLLDRLHFSEQLWGWTNFQVPTIEVIAHDLYAAGLDPESVITSRVRTKVTDTGNRSEQSSKISLPAKGLRAKLAIPGLPLSFAGTNHIDFTGQILASQQAKQETTSTTTFTVERKLR